MGSRLSREQKQLAFRLRAKGLTLKEIGRPVGCDGSMVSVMVHGGRHRDGSMPGRHRQTSLRTWTSGQRR